MIWFISAGIAVASVVIGIVVYAKKQGIMQILLTVTTFLVASYVIYLPVYVQNGDILNGVFGNLIHTLQMLTVDADFSEFSALISAELNSSVFNAIYTVIRGILHIALPLMSAMSLFSIIFKCFSTIELKIANIKKRPIYIFSERNERALELVESLKGVKCDIVFTGVEDTDLENNGESSRGFIYKEEDVSDLEISKKKNKEIYYFCLTEDGDKCLSQVLSLIEKLSKLDSDEQDNVHVYLFSKSEDYSIYIDSSNKGNINLHCINEYETQVQNLLDKYPLINGKDSKIHVLLYGFNKLNQIAFKNIIWCGQLANHLLQISIVGVDIKKEVEQVKYEAPNVFLNSKNIKIYDCKSEIEACEVVKEKCADANYIIVNGKTDNETMDQGVSLRRLFYCNDKSFSNCPPIYCYVNDPAKHNILKNLATAEAKLEKKVSYNLIPFGSISEVYSSSCLLNSDVERLAKNVHLAYEEIFSDGPIDVKEAIKRYNLFEINKRSNRANALHIRYKLRLLGLDYVESDGTEGENLLDYLNEENKEMLFRAEHDRWLVFYESEGWTQSTKEDVYAYRNSGISKGRHNCPLLKKHPYICGYDDLKDLSEEIEGKDTTIYDKELILRIPDILGDKWGVAKKKYKIIKLDTTDGKRG